MKKDNKERLAFNIKEAAAILGVSKPTMHRILPEIQHKRFGRRVLIPRTALQTWLESEDRQVAA